MSLPVLHLPPGSLRRCPTAFVLWETEATKHSWLTSPCWLTAKGLHVHPTLPSALLLLSATASATVAGTDSLGNTELSVCCRGLRTLVSNWKHVIMQDYRTIELGETWKDHKDDSRTARAYITRNTSSFNKPEPSLTEAYYFLPYTYREELFPASFQQLFTHFQNVVKYLYPSLFNQRTPIHKIFAWDFILTSIVPTALRSNCPVDPHLSTVAPKIWIMLQLRLYLV